MSEEEIDVIKQELHEKLEEIKEYWERLRIWADENGMDLGTCEMRSRLMVSRDEQT